MPDEVKDYSYVQCLLKCNDIDTIRPQITIFSKDPVELFKSKYTNFENMQPDSIAQKWNDFVIDNNSDKMHNMFKEGALLCSQIKGTYWVVTTAIQRDQSLYFWSEKAIFKTRYNYRLHFSCKNRIIL